jgi:D-sedoheptulose 7-phosphate isomerase
VTALDAPGRRNLCLLKEDGDVNGTGRDYIEGFFARSLAALTDAARDSSLLDTIGAIAAAVRQSFGEGGKLLIAGNGGSAADAQHLAAELVGRFRRTRPGLPALALTANASALTAIANDFSYDEVFARQVEALCREADVVIGISTSGQAASVARGLQAARTRGARTWALTGSQGGIVAEVAESALLVPSDVTARIQEIHVTIIHAVSELVDAHAADRAPP